MIDVPRVNQPAVRPGTMDNCHFTRVNSQSVTRSSRNIGCKIDNGDGH